MSISPSYSKSSAAKFNQPMSAEYHQQASSYNPMLTSMGNYPVACNCPFCHQPILTRAEKEVGLAVWLSSALICVFGCFCGCCLIPFCMDDMKDTIHYCPNCNRVIAEDKRLKL